MSVMAPNIPKKSRQRGWPALLHRAARTIRSNQLIEPGQHVLVGISGGPDSVALLSLLHRLSRSWRFSLSAAHFNYGLRGRESDEDEQFVAELCRALEVPLSVMALDVRSRVRGTSLQAVARDLRYRAMTSMAKECGADRIAVGHTADDQAETVLLWMLRGTGLRGLSGMPVSREGRIVRPLYDCSRRQVLEYLNDAGLSYRQDSSNATGAYARNRIRQDLLPVMTRLHPSSVRTLCRLATLCREDDGYLEAQTAALSAEHIRQGPDGGWVVKRPFVQQLPRALQRRLVRDLLRRCDAFERAPTALKVEQVIQAVMSKGPGQLRVNKCAQILIEDDAIRLMAFVEQDAAGLPQGPLSIDIPPDGSAVTWAGTNQTIRMQRLAKEQLEDTRPRPLRIVVDGERVSESLTIRPWQRGDRFYPCGMKGRSKKLQDYFTDLKMPAGMRNRIPIVVSPEGIVWIVGYRQDERWAVTPGTRQCLVLTASRGSTGEGAL